MDDLISRQAAIEAVSDYIHNVDKVIGTGKLSKEDCRDAAESVLEELPSVQPEIIHCKDCSFSNGKPIADGRCWCNITHAYMHYCSDAERRTDESD